jgi:UPF0755 protein
VKPRILAILAAICALFLLGMGLLYWAVLLPAGKGQAQTVRIAKGASLRYVAHKLKERGLIRSETAFRLIARRSWTKVRQGEYRFQPPINPLRILDKLVKGQVEAYWVTVPEGFTLQQIASLLAERQLATKNDFLTAASAASQLDTEFPKPTGSLEGYLFPDTYRLDARQDMSAALIVAMVRRFDEVVWKGLLKGKAPQTGLTLHELVTLASLVEGEAKKDEERPIIAGVLLNRLRMGKKLECDATVQYALGDHKSRLLYADLQYPSPYNTYLHEGLPPGPINNPGLASIEAALKPADTPYLYYVAKPDGSHIFSRTPEEHQAAIARVRRSMPQK